jgi:DNA polymerase III delta prime subunit
MHAHILTGGNQDSRAKYLADLDNSQTELIHLVAAKSTLTIQQIKDLWTPLSIAPRLNRIVWIEEANLLTVPAQNALLKMLEEPPQSTAFYLTCASAASLLPTIRSRCQTIIRPASLQGGSTIYDLRSLKEIMSLSPGDRLTAIVKRDRGESILWISQIESALKGKLADPTVSKAGTQTLAKIAHLALEAHTQLLANCSVSLVTQNFYLHLPHVLQ